MTNETKASEALPTREVSPNVPLAKVGGSTTSGLAFRILLVAGICLNLLYLTRDLGVRIDLTQEKLYSLSPSTRRILERVEKPLVIEAYFSKDLPSHLEPDRRKMEDLLDEYVQMGKNLIKVVYLDPTTDKSLGDRARRLGMQGMPVQVLKSASMSMQMVWQGLRIRYGGDRQKILPVVQSSLSLEEQLTPTIYELVLQRKPKVGFISVPNTQPRNQFQQQPQAPAPGWQMVQQLIRGRYDVVPIDLSKGQQLPEDLEVLVLIEPKNMSDWEKYCIDQHIMRGGKVLLFVDAADYGYDPYQPFTRLPFQVDVPDSKLSFKDQLMAYGVNWGQHVVAEMISPRLQGLAQTFVFGPDGRRPINLETKYMPYWMKVVKQDWSVFAGRLTKEPAAQAKLAKELGWGLDPSNPVFRQDQEVGLFWPTDVALADKMPEGITGETLMRTSPKGVAQIPPQGTSPQNTNVGNNIRLRELANSEAKQISLAVQVTGLFTSAFAGKKRPERPGQDKKGGLLAQDESSNKTAAPEQDKDQGDKDQGDKDQGDKDQGDKDQGDKAGQEKKGEAAGDQEGPVFRGAPKPEAEAEQEKLEDKLPPKLDKAEKEGRILVIGDANVIRDDHISARFPQWMSQNMPGMVRSLYSVQGRSLFQNLLDWMALDLDLVELRARRSVDRKLDFVGDVSPDEDQDLLKARVATKKMWIQWTNILLPMFVLLAFGLILLLKRVAEKRAFLSSVKATG